MREFANAVVVVGLAACVGGCRGADEPGVLFR